MQLFLWSVTASLFGWIGIFHTSLGEVTHHLLTLLQGSLTGTSSFVLWSHLCSISFLPRAGYYSLLQDFPIYGFCHPQIVWHFDTDIFPTENFSSYQLAELYAILGCTILQMIWKLVALPWFLEPCKAGSFFCDLVMVKLFSRKSCLCTLLPVRAQIWSLLLLGYLMNSFFLLTCRF